MENISRRRLSNGSSDRASTVLKNAGDVQWSVSSYPYRGYVVSKQGDNLVLTESAPEPAKKDNTALVAVVGMVAVLCAVTTVSVFRKRF